MRSFGKLIPEHFSGGENLTAEDIAPLNERLRRMPKMVMFVIPILCGIPLGILLGLGLSFPEIVGGPLGTLLTVLCILLMPLVLIIPGKVMKSFRKRYSSEGITEEAFQKAMLNLRNDRRAWGEPAKAEIRHRFTCRKCHEDSGWFSTGMTSCTEETMRAKTAEFRRLTEKKKKYYVNSSGFAVYDLERKCPHCGAVQRKGPLRWWSIPLTMICTFLVYMIALVTTLQIRDSLKQKWTETDDAVSMILFFALMIGSLVWTIVRYRKERKKKPEYEIAAIGDGDGGNG